MKIWLYTIASGVTLAYLIRRYGLSQRAGGVEQGRLIERAIQGQRTAALAARIMRGSEDD